MTMLVVQLTGVAVFVLVTIVVGILLRRSDEPRSAEALSRASHVAFWFGLVVPWTVGMFVPGPGSLDQIAGFPPLPMPVWFRIAFGGALLVAGVLAVQLSISRLGRSGRGAPAIKLTSAVVSTGPYALVRNPMALGFYTALIGGAVLSGSTYVLLYSCLLIAAHVFNLRFFEELELLVRYGDSYRHYRDSTPFLIPRVRPRRGK